MKGFTRDGTLFKVINSMCSSLVSHDWDSNLPIPISKFDFCFIILWHHIRCLSRFFFLIFFSLVVPRCFLFSVFLTISFNAKYQGLNAVVSVAHHTQTKKRKKKNIFCISNTIFELIGLENFRTNFWVGMVGMIEL